MENLKLFVIFFLIINLLNIIILKQNCLAKESNPIDLPKYKTNGIISVEKAMYERRSVRNFSDKPIEVEKLSQILWSSYGISSNPKYKVVPSAGALYPLEIYVVIGNVKGLQAGIYYYDCKHHKLILKIEGDKRNELYQACLKQPWVKEAPLSIVICANYSKTSIKYGRRAERYVHMEVGHSAQNISLQCVALDLGTVCVGAFDDETVKEILSLPKNEYPLYVMPIGYQK